MLVIICIYGLFGILMVFILDKLFFVGEYCFVDFFLASIGEG